MWLLAQELRVLEKFGGSDLANQTNINPLGFAIFAVCGLLLIALPRRWAALPCIFQTCMVSAAQQIVVAGLDFSLIRLMVICGFLRILLRREYASIRWQRVDGVILAFAAVRTVAYTIQRGGFDALTFQVGRTFEEVGLYFMFRCLIRNWDDLIGAIKGFVLISVPVAVAFVIENRTAHNAFSVFGGVPAITTMREGRLRCQGAFAHPIIAGCFWASMMPLAAALWWQGNFNRLLSILGCITFALIVVLCASSTPVMGIIFALVGAAMFFVRWWMRYVLIGVACLLVILHFSMKAPVWHLIARINISKGNTGYHRFQIIDNAIHRFTEWALVGTRSTAHWFWGGQDVTNHYVLEGVRGGFLTLVLFVTTIVLCFGAAGRLWRTWATNRSKMILAWALGVSLFVHCTNFIGVSYFGQAVLVWFLVLASLVSLDEQRALGPASIAPRPTRPRPARLGPIGFGPFNQPAATRIARPIARTEHSA